MSKWYLSIEPIGSQKRRQVELTSVAQLDEELRTLIENGEGSAYLSQSKIGGSEKSDFLLVGVSGSTAFAHFNPIDPPGTPQEHFRPYLWAVCGRDQFVVQQPIDFDIGGTDTTVPPQRCIETQRMLQIAKDYFENGALPDSVTWEEDDA